MEKTSRLSTGHEPQPQRAPKSGWFHTVLLLLSSAVIVYHLNVNFGGLFSATKDGQKKHNDGHDGSLSPPYGVFPRPNDPFRFIPCTDTTLPPPLEDAHHDKAWAALFDPNPDHWSWGNTTADESRVEIHDDNDPYAGRGIYLCGYIDAPMDYTNESDPRIVRLAVTKYQVSGLAHVNGSATESSSAGRKSLRTLIIEPGGPGGSGVSFVWRAAENVTRILSSGEFDVLGWDPRGVNTSLPAAACYPYDADRDRWALLTNQYRYTVADSPWPQLEFADAMYNATFAACKQKLGDFPRFVSTTFVARDLEQIRIALDEPEVTGYFVSYGTGIGQTYANMFPDRVGRLILDGTEYVRDHRLLGGFGWTALDNATDAWRDGFLGECVAAGPEYCALARPQGQNGGVVTLSDLETRMSTLLESLAARPIPAYTPSSGPSLVTYSRLVAALYQCLYTPPTWPGMAKALYELERGNSSLVARMLDDQEWQFQPPSPCPTTARTTKTSTEELGWLVICADSYDAPLPPFSDEDAATDPDGLRWWSSLWANMTAKSWVSGDSRFHSILPCRHYVATFGSAAEVYRGPLNHSLANPLLLIAEVYDPATPLRNGRRLLKEMGHANARLVVHHGYGHSSQRDVSACTNAVARTYILTGELPEALETACYADGKPYRDAVVAASGTDSRAGDEGDEDEAALVVWREHMRELASSHPGLIRRV